MLLPPAKLGLKGRFSLRKSPSTLVKRGAEITLLIERLFAEGVDTVLDVVSGMPYWKAHETLRLMQWLCILEAFDTNKPFTEGIRRIVVRETKLYRMINNNLGFLSPREKACSAITLAFLLPSPSRTVLHFSLQANTIQELSSLLARRGRTLIERLIGIHALHCASARNDILLLLEISNAMGFTRPGKKSDPGAKPVYLRRLKRGIEWLEHPCTNLSPLTGTALLSFERKLYGSEIAPVTGIRYDDYAPLREGSRKHVLADPRVLREVKKSLPELYGWCLAFFNLEHEKPPVVSHPQAGLEE